ncbi:MAG: leucine-rich repeat protein [Clostridia bacterium]|nr:leucine-rich repeat protein [Clostridia bacterium]
MKRDKKKRVLYLVLIASLVAAACLVIAGCSCDRETSTYRVSFTTYVSGKTEPAQTVAEGGLVKAPTVDLGVREGYYFDGWYAGSKKWDFEKDTVHKDTVIVAKWVRYLTFIPAGDGTDGYWVRDCYYDAENVVIPSEYNGKKVTGIEWAFANRTKLKSVTIPNTVYYISEKAFAGCTSLEEIVIPKSVTIVGNNAFTSCPNLGVILCEAESQPTTWKSGFNNTRAKVIWDYLNKKQ